MPRPFQPTSHPGTLHRFAKRLIAFEHHPSASPGDIDHPNTLLFLGGLGDGLLHPPYPSLIAPLLPPSWRVVEVQLSSSYSGWTTTSLRNDVTEVSAAVSYFRSLTESTIAGKIVLMGHSTGCQICMQYLTNGSTPSVRATPPSRPLAPIDGIILQAPVSDREAISTSSVSDSAIEATIALARAWIADGRGGDVLPASSTPGRQLFGASPSAERWVSLVEAGGGDDYFSSDLGDEVLEGTFGELGRGHCPILCLESGSDEFVPGEVDKEGLVGRWEGFVKRNGGRWSEESGIVPGANHNLVRGGEDVVRDVTGRVSRFLQKVETGWASGEMKL